MKTPVHVEGTLPSLTRPRNFQSSDFMAIRKKQMQSMRKSRSGFFLFGGEPLTKRRIIAAVSL